jgi:hypothetical protein
MLVPGLKSRCDKRHSAERRAVCTEKLNPDVVVMKSAKDPV